MSSTTSARSRLGLGLTSILPTTTVRTCFRTSFWDSDFYFRLNLGCRFTFVLVFVIVVSVAIVFVVRRGLVLLGGRSRSLILLLSRICLLRRAVLLMLCRERGRGVRVLPMLMWGALSVRHDEMGGSCWIWGLGWGGEGSRSLVIDCVFRLIWLVSSGR